MKNLVAQTARCYLKSFLAAALEAMILDFPQVEQVLTGHDRAVPLATNVGFDVRSGCLKEPDNICLLVLRAENCRPWQKFTSNVRTGGREMIGDWFQIQTVCCRIGHHQSGISQYESVALASEEQKTLSGKRRHACEQDCYSRIMIMRGD